MCTHLGVSKNNGTPKSSILNHFNRVFHYKPSILGAHPYFWKHQFRQYLRHIECGTRQWAASLTQLLLGTKLARFKALLDMIDIDGCLGRLPTVARLQRCFKCQMHRGVLRESIGHRNFEARDLISRHPAKPWHGYWKPFQPVFGEWSPDKMQ